MKIPYSIFEDGQEPQFHMLDENSKIEIEFLNGTKKTVGTEELMRIDRKGNPDELIIHTKVLEK